jgi:hypothetical protein
VQLEEFHVTHHRFVGGGLSRKIVPPPGFEPGRPFPGTSTSSWRVYLMFHHGGIKCTRLDSNQHCLSTSVLSGVAIPFAYGCIGASKSGVAETGTPFGDSVSDLSSVSSDRILGSGAPPSTQS